jgi:hypothetical protein
MIISGYDLKGYRISGTRTVLSFPVKLYLDYRFNVTTQNISGVDRVVNYNDLSSSQYSFVNSFPSLPNSFPRYSNQGLWLLNQGSVAPMRATPNSKLNFLHNGNPFIIISVGKIPTVSGVNNGWILLRTTSSASSVGHRLQISGSLRRIEWRVSNGITDIVSVTGATNQIPLDEDFFSMLTFYGGTSANNFQLHINNSFSNFTVNTTAYSLANSSVLNYLGRITGSIGELYNKLLIAVDCTGKTLTEINDIRSRLIETIKTDPEYSLLTTP